MGDLERIIACRSEVDVLAEELVKQLQEVQVEQEELLVAERVLRLAGQDRAEAEIAVVASLASARAAGQAVLLIPRRGEDVGEAALPGDYRKIPAIASFAVGASLMGDHRSVRSLLDG
ncbi:hypothetical protein ACGFZQ_49665 [Streptomyces sp. NPDC048254]|uniref:hypothetical protein n=1 Tax=Streptomyces sp. NPDC048254 TaxID=3365525 RepID=UPI00371DD3D3